MRSQRPVRILAASLFFAVVSSNAWGQSYHTQAYALTHGGDEHYHEFFDGSTAIAAALSEDENGRTLVQSLANVGAGRLGVYSYASVDNRNTPDAAFGIAAQSGGDNTFARYNQAELTVNDALVRRTASGTTPSSILARLNLALSGSLFYEAITPVTGQAAQSSVNGRIDAEFSIVQNGNGIAGGQATLLWSYDAVHGLDLSTAGNLPFSTADLANIPLQSGAFSLQTNVPFSVTLRLTGQARAFSPLGGESTGLAITNFQDTLNWRTDGPVFQFFDAGGNDVTPSYTADSVQGGITGNRFALAVSAAPEPGVLPLVLPILFVIGPRCARGRHSGSSSGSTISGVGGGSTPDTGRS